MKKILLILALAFTGCQKETPQPPANCTCGIVMNEGIENDCYFVDVKNDCSGNVKRFCLNSNDWMNFHVNDPICMSNENAW